MHSALLIATLAITHVTVIDVASGNLRRDVTVVVRGDRIESSGSAVPKDAQIVDGHGKFLIPGLWDMHVHLSWTKESALMLLVANGVTGVRDLGGKLSELDEWRTKIAAGLIIGPRIFRAGPILNGQKFNQFQMVPGNANETRGVVRALKEVGVDFIKVHRRMLRDSYFAAIDEAKKQGLPLVGHIPMTVTPEEASDAGQATIEHVATLFEGTFSAALNGRKLPDA
ncbi:MAG TPA: amidohydrolase, partial [Thermoanaerobaculia bacterium]